MRMYVLRTAGLTAERAAAMEAALPAPRRAALERVGRDAARRESIGAAWLALGALGAGNTADGVEMVRPEAPPFSQATVRRAGEAYGWPVGAHGKPFPDGVPAGDAQLYVSLSHSDGYAAAAIADEPVGMDLQVKKSWPANTMLRIARRFHPEERAELERLADTGPDRLEEAFCRLWTAKESLLKLDGRGMAGGLNAFCVRPDGTARLDGRNARVRTYSLPDAAATVAVWT